MSDGIEARIAAVHAAHAMRYAEYAIDDGEMFTCLCGTKFPWSRHDPDEKVDRDHATHVARVLVEELGLTQEWAVSSGERRQFERFNSREDAEWALANAVGNNERWVQAGRELALWMRDPRIETRHFTNWERDHE